MTPLRAILFATLLLIAEGAVACECIRVNSGTETLSNGESRPSKLELSAPGTFIFVGIARKVEPVPSGDPAADQFFVAGSVTSFEVQRSWNFVAPKRVLLTSGFRGCGFLFKEGARYVVFAQRKEHGELTTSICTRTAATEDVPDLLPVVKKLLGRGERPRARRR